MGWVCTGGCALAVCRRMRGGGRRSRSSVALWVRALTHAPNWPWVCPWPFLPARRVRQGRAERGRRHSRPGAHGGPGCGGEGAAPRLCPRLPPRVPARRRRRAPHPYPGPHCHAAAEPHRERGWGRPQGGRQARHGGGSRHAHRRRCVASHPRLWQPGVLAAAALPDSKPPPGTSDARAAEASCAPFRHACGTPSAACCLPLFLCRRRTLPRQTPAACATCGASLRRLGAAPVSRAGVAGARAWPSHHPSPRACTHATTSTTTLCNHPCHGPAMRAGAPGELSMDGAQFMKLCRDSGLLTRGLSSTRVDLIFRTTAAKVGGQSVKQGWGGEVRGREGRGREGREIGRAGAVGGLRGCVGLRAAGPCTSQPRGCQVWATRKQRLQPPSSSPHLPACLPACPAPCLQGARRITYSQFQAALPRLAEARGCEEGEVVSRIVASTGPTRNNTTTPEAVRLSDRSSFTGGWLPLGGLVGREKAARCWLRSIAARLPHRPAQRAASSGVAALADTRRYRRFSAPPSCACLSPRRHRGTRRAHHCGEGAHHPGRHVRPQRAALLPGPVGAGCGGGLEALIRTADGRLAAGCVGWDWCSAPRSRRPALAGWTWEHRGGCWTAMGLYSVHSSGRSLMPHSHLSGGLSGGRGDSVGATPSASEGPLDPRLCALACLLPSCHGLPGAGCQCVAIGNAESN